jgi:hypothetical protein
MKNTNADEKEEEEKFEEFKTTILSELETIIDEIERLSDSINMNVQNFRLC